MDINSLEKRILDRIVFVSILIVLLYALIQTLDSIFKNEQIFIEDNIYTYLVLLVYASYYLFKRLRIRFSILKIIIFVVFYGSFLGAFFNVNGFDAVTTLDMVNLILAGIFLFPTPKGRVILIATHVVIIGILFYIEINLPHTIRNIITVNEQVNLAIGLFTRLLLTINLSVVIIQEYRREQDIIGSKNQEIQHLNTELQTTNTELKKTNHSLSQTVEELKMTQGQLIQNEKMASIGILTAGVAHEINNPLNYIMGAYVGLEDYFRDHGSADVRATGIFLSSIKEGIDRASNIVNGLNQFSRKSDTLNEDCDIHYILNNCLVIMENKLKEHVQVHKDFANDIPEFKGNVGKLHQVFINILTNSIQAIEDRGEIFIVTRNHNGRLHIAVSDNGCGIKKEDIKKIINPFFTTKPPGEGTGLGLSIAYSIIKEHRGEISFKSEPDEGTTVNIEIPISK